MNWAKSVRLDVSLTPSLDPQLLPSQFENETAVATLEEISDGAMKKLFEALEKERVFTDDTIPNFKKCCLIVIAVVEFFTDYEDGDGKEAKVEEQRKVRSGKSDAKSKRRDCARSERQDCARSER